MDIVKLSKEYDRIYEETNRLFKQHDPCQFIGNRCKLNRWCLRGRCGHTYHKNTELNNGCCGGYNCKYHTSKGCSTKALGCKLTTCGRMYDTSSREFRTDIIALKEEASKVLGRLIGHAFISKEEFFDLAREKRNLC